MRASKCHSELQGDAEGFSWPGHLATDFDERPIFESMDDARWRNDDLDCLAGLKELSTIPARYTNGRRVAHLHRVHWSPLQRRYVYERRVYGSKQ